MALVLVERQRFGGGVVSVGGENNKFLVVAVVQ